MIIFFVRVLPPAISSDRLAAGHPSPIVAYSLSLADRVTMFPEEGIRQVRESVSSIRYLGLQSTEQVVQKSCRIARNHLRTCNGDST